ncbi:MAG TPA: hypothetical protein VGL94_07360 [Ktedonobacteraceae bacterium]|jgi:hypothetical protein
MALEDNLKEHKETAMLQAFVRNAVTRLGVADYLRGLSNILHPVYKRDHVDDQHL